MTGLRAPVADEKPQLSATHVRLSEAEEIWTQRLDRNDGLQKAMVRVDPRPVEIMYESSTEENGLMREWCFEDPYDSERPRLIVSLGAVLSLKVLVEEQVAKCAEL